MTLIMKHYLEEFVTPDLHTRSMHLEVETVKDSFRKN